MKKYIHTLWESTHQNISARISISYFSLTRTKSPRVLDRFYIHVGNLVVSIGLSREETLSRTLRDMLIHMHVFPITLDRHLKLLLSDGFQTISPRAVLMTPNKPSVIAFPNRKPPFSLPFLMESLTSLMVDFYLHALPGRVSIPAFSGKREMVDCLAMNYCILLERYAMLSSKENDFSLETVSTIPS